MRIGELARRAGVTPRALRYYEEQGLLAPERRPSGYREYDERDVDTVRGIRTLLAAGLNSTVIAEILHGLPLPGQRPPGPTCPELLAGLARERARITRQMDELDRARGLLDAIMGARAPGEAIRSGRIGAAERTPGADASPSDASPAGATAAGATAVGATAVGASPAGASPAGATAAGAAAAGDRRPRSAARKLDGARSRAVLE
ncbi:MerR family transcriptional regulator [Kitasatospora sp. NPDC091257]|uniref:MerR family transcriptional regulator n=1 Tax=Kitasatospora sp. NPDC091257 TaxID=3364084 RepID=UPI00380913F3